MPARTKKEIEKTMAGVASVLFSPDPKAVAQKALRDVPPLKTR